MTISPVTWLLSYSQLYHRIAVIPLALLICETIEYVCAGCPNLDRIENEGGYTGLGFKMRNTPLGGKGGGGGKIPNLKQKKLESLRLTNCFAYTGKHMQNMFIQNMYQQKINLCFSMAHKAWV